MREFMPPRDGHQDLKVIFGESMHIWQLNGVASSSTLLRLRAGC